MSTEYLLDVFFTKKNPDWLSVVTRLTLMKGVAVTVTEDKAVVYGEKEPLELVFPSVELRLQLIEAFTNQGKELHLIFDGLLEVGDQS
jgi:hypothetical protein